MLDDDYWHWNFIESVQVIRKAEFQVAELLAFKLEIEIAGNPVDGCHLLSLVKPASRRSPLPQ